MISSLLINVAGILVFLFIFWKKLREDFSSEVVFRFAVTVLSFLFVGEIVSTVYNFPFYFLIWSVSVLLAIVFLILRYRANFFEILEAVYIGLLPWLSAFYLRDAVIAKSFNSFIAFLIVLFLILIFYLTSQNYKKILWYKSGRLGFAGLTGIFLMFATRLAVALTVNNVVSFYRSFDIYASISICLLTLSGVVYLNFKE